MSDTNNINEKTRNAETTNQLEVVEKSEKVNVKKEIFSWIKIFAIAAVIAFVISRFIIINANVPSGSMEKTIMTKDRMIGLRTAYWFSEPERGDIVIFKFPDDESQLFVKRVIGLPGDKVTIKNAKIYINDSREPLKEDYLPEEWTYLNGSGEPLEYQVPEGHYFVLGDNRNYSKDAREWKNTFVEESKIVAEAKFVYWPKKNVGILKSAEY